MSGILHMLLLALFQNAEFNLNKKLGAVVKNTVDVMLKQVLPSGNFPANLNDKTDKEVTFNHGAPGAVFMFLEAYYQYEEQ